MGRVATGLAGAILLSVLVITGCDGSGHSGADRLGAPLPGRAGSALTPAPPGSASGQQANGSDGAAAGGGAATTLPGSRCQASAVVAAWPLTRKAAELVVVPVLGADPGAVQVAISSGSGGILLLGTMPPAGALKSDLMPVTSAPRSGSGPPLVMVDEEGGGVQRLLPDVNPMPWPRQMAASMSTDALRSLAGQVGAQMRALGVDVDLAPVLDLDGGTNLSTKDPDGPRSFSTAAPTAAAYGQAFAAGLQAAGVLPVLKHFPGLGGATGNTDYGPASTRPLTELESAGLVPFEQLAAKGAEAVMISNATVPGLSTRPASVSSAVINGLLRQQLHFDGLVITDSLSAGAISAAGYGVAAAAVASIEAGSDMVLFGSTLTASAAASLAPGPLAATTTSIVDAIVAASRSGALPRSRLDGAVLHVLHAKGVDPCLLR
jgi:beta-N-acetylhexosaminidase